MINRYIMSGIFCLGLSLLLMNIDDAKASLIEPDYDPSDPLVTTPWYEVYSHENYLADAGFISGMRPHHAGALTMAQEYLQSDKKSSHRLQDLAQSIIDNQTFEILILDEIKALINAVEFTTTAKTTLHQVATVGLSQREKFVRTAIPALTHFFDDTVSSEDVRFAKAMIVHHEGALTMCNSYLDNPSSTNGYLERMCLDILRDQTQEINLMKDIISEFDGNPDDVVIDPSMIHGMDAMMHNHHM